MHSRLRWLKKKRQRPKNPQSQMSNKSQLHQPLQLSCLLRRATQMISRLRGAALMVLMMSKRMVHSQLRIKRSLKAQTSQTRSLKRAKIRLQQPMAKNRLTRHQLSNMKVAVLTMNGRIRTKKHLLQIPIPLDGLADSSRHWWRTFRSPMLSCGFKSLSLDLSIFVAYDQGRLCCVCGVHVDDLFGGDDGKVGRTFRDKIEKAFMWGYMEPQ